MKFLITGSNGQPAREFVRVLEGANHEGSERQNIEVVKTILKLLGKPEDLIELTKDRLGRAFMDKFASVSPPQLVQAEKIRSICIALQVPY